MRSRLGQCFAATGFGQRYLCDIAFRGQVSLHLGMAYNFCYAAFRVAVGVRYTSPWFISMAAYYLVLGGLRAYLTVCYRRRSPEQERRQKEVRRH